MKVETGKTHLLFKMDLLPTLLALLRPHFLSSKAMKE
jgi:hypothetical protein